jgi:hypothetical protein
MRRILASLTVFLWVAPAYAISCDGALKTQINDLHLVPFIKMALEKEGVTEEIRHAAYAAEAYRATLEFVNPQLPKVLKLRAPAAVEVLHQLGLVPPSEITTIRQAAQAIWEANLERAGMVPELPRTFRSNLEYVGIAGPVLMGLRDDITPGSEQLKLLMRKYKRGSTLGTIISLTRALRPTNALTDERVRGTGKLFAIMAYLEEIIGKKEFDIQDFVDELKNGGFLTDEDIRDSRARIDEELRLVLRGTPARVGSRAYRQAKIAAAQDIALRYDRSVLNDLVYVHKVIEEFYGPNAPINQR